MATPIRTVLGTNGDPLAEAIELTKRLKLPHIRRSLTDIIPTAKAQRWDPAEVVRVLLSEEAADRDRANLHTRRKRAEFPTGKTFGDWHESTSSIPGATQDALKSLEWVGRRESLCICGPSGTGKSHFTEALGQTAVEAGLAVAWFTIEDLGMLVRRHRADDSIARALAKIVRSDLIIVDDIGLLPVSEDAAEGFYRLADAAYERRSIAVSSNLHPSGFDEIMPTTLATATVDRLLHHAHVTVTQGDSFRFTEATTGKGVKPSG
ncbi:IS21-like element helper ATPase IstB [Streptomyces sp. NBC_00237]|uniref:IS21-like element helper ATPase IstB n=1 Tax=Streptomyces sp. NBC_00237 TaxID=2975687 RepID=UPI00225493B8|nr:IS21-like element helper ATPase IstB [Streptomyces sp. NBC_00237]MCX5207660.1 IS21-like element helper ATPase IstB [Streptomyces sp. NBC_00237]